MSGKQVGGSVLRLAGVIGGTAAQLVAASTSTRLVAGIVIKADDANTSVVYVGESSSVAASAGAAASGFPLAAGQALVLNIDDASKIWLIGGAAGQNYVAIGAARPVA